MESKSIYILADLFNYNGFSMKTNSFTELILLSEVLLKRNELHDRLTSTFAEDLKIVLPENLQSLATWYANQDSPLYTKIYTEFKQYLVKNSNTTSKDPEEIFTILAKLWTNEGYLFRENSVMKVVMDWVTEGFNDKFSLYFPFNNMVTAEEECDFSKVCITAPYVYIPSLVIKLLSHLVKCWEIHYEAPISSFDILYHDDSTKFDAGFSCPPFMVKFKVNDETKFVETACIDNMLKKVKGRFATIIVSGHVFSGNPVSQGKLEKYVKSGRLKAVVELPSGFLRGTNVFTVILFFDDETSKHNSVTMLSLANGICYETKRTGRQKTFINHYGCDELKKVLKDIPSTLAVKVTVNELVQNSYNLCPARYCTIKRAFDGLSKFGERNIRLADVATLYRAQMVKKEDTGKTYFEIGAADINESGFVIDPRKEIFLSEDRSNLKNLVHKGDILIAIKGSVGKVGFINEEQKNWVAGQSFIIIRVKDKNWPPEFLFWQLKSKTVIEYFKGIASGSVLPLLKIDDIRNLMLLPPSSELLKKVKNIQKEKTDLLVKIKELSSKLKVLNEMV